MPLLKIILVFERKPNEPYDLYDALGDDLEAEYECAVEFDDKTVKEAKLEEQKKLLGE